MTQVHKDIHYAQTKSVKRLRAPLLSQKGKGHSMQVNGKFCQQKTSSAKLEQCLTNKSEITWQKKEVY